MRKCHFLLASYTLAIILNEDIGHHTFGNIGIGFFTLSEIYFPFGKLILLQNQFVFLKICGIFIRAEVYNLCPLICPSFDFLWCISDGNV